MKKKRRKKTGDFADKAKMARVVNSLLENCDNKYVKRCYCPINKNDIDFDDECYPYKYFIKTSCFRTRRGFMYNYKMFVDIEAKKNGSYRILVQVNVLDLTCTRGLGAVFSKIYSVSTLEANKVG